uniref:Uncharacterized protein n=1 Tax=candidate division WOR-3 bacterium TaxID=2052148 RepID=A0A7V3RIN9_UNCW3
MLPFYRGRLTIKNFLNIILVMDMNKVFLTILIISNLIWAIQPVPKEEKLKKDDKPLIIFKNNYDFHKPEEPPVVMKERKEQKNDQFIDTDSNNVNDQRENDLLKIKRLKKKFKDIFKMKSGVEAPPKGH